MALALEGLGLAVIVAARGSLAGSAARVVVVAFATFLAIRAIRSGSHVRGAVCVGAGLIGVVVGLAIGVSHLARAGVAPMSLGGTLCLAASLIVLASGTTTLIRRAKGWRKALALPIVLLLFQFVAVPLFGAIAITNAPPDDVGSRTPGHHGLPHQEVTFETSDGVRLSGWYVPSSNRAAVVALAGSGSTRSGVLEHAAVLARHGYGTLVLDNRGHGDSDGVAMETGWYGDLDISAAVDFLATRPDVDPHRIAVLGLSMGGEEAIGAIAADRRIGAVVAEGATARDSADHVYPTADVSGWIERIVTWEQYRFADVLTDAGPPTPLADAASAAAPRPLLLIAGRGEEAANRRLHDASPGNTQLWVLPDTRHVGALDEHPAEWEQRVVTFLSSALPVA